MSNFQGIYPAATFTRATTAYDPLTTALTTTGTPRYIPGRFQNLVKTASDFESSAGWVFDTQGGYTTPATYTRALQTTTKWQGTQAAELTISGSTLSTDGVRVYRYIQTAGAATANAHALGTFLPGVSYTFSFWINVTALTGSASVVITTGLDGGNTSVTSQTFSAVTNGWTRGSATFIPNAATTSIYMYVALRANTANSTGTVFIDAAQVERGTLTNWRAGGTGKGIFVEEGTTNLVLNGDFSNGTANWNANQIVTLSTVTETDGLIYGKCVSNQAGSTPGILSDAIACTASTTYTITMKAKRSGTNAYLYVWTNLGNLVWSTILIPTTITELTSTFTTPVGATTMKVGALQSPGVNGDWIEIGRVQIEQKGYATSWQVNGTPRNAETLTIPVPGVSASTGTIEMWAFLAATSSTAWYPIDWYFGTGTNNQRIVVYGTQTSLQLLVGDGLTNVTTSTASLAAGWNYIAARWGSSGIALTVNGTTVTQTGVTHGPTAPAAVINIGCAYNGTGHASACYDAVRLSNTYLTNGQIAANYVSAIPPAADQTTVASFNFDGNLLSHTEVKAIVTPPGNLHLRGSLILG